MEKLTKANAIARELGLNAHASRQLKSDIKGYIERWNRFSPLGQTFHELNDSDLKHHCSMYLDKGWNKDERLDKGEAKASIISPGRQYWNSWPRETGAKQPKYEWGRNTKDITEGVQKIFEIYKAVRMNGIQERQLTLLNIHRQTKNESESIDTTKASADDFRQKRANEHVVPESPELSPSDGHLSELPKGQARAAAAHNFTTSSQQSLFLHDDDKSFRPAPSELDPLEFVRGDTEFDAAGLFGGPPRVDTTSQGLRSPSHASPKRYASKKGGVEPRSRARTSKETTQKQKRKVEAGSEAEEGGDRTFVESENAYHQVSSDEDSLPSVQSLLLPSATFARRKHISTEANVEHDIRTPESLASTTPATKRRKVVGAPDTDPSTFTKYSGTSDKTPMKGSVADYRPEPTASSGESQHTDSELPHDEVRSQTFAPVPLDSGNDARYVMTNISTGLEDRLDFSSRIAGLSEAENPRPQCSILYWVLKSRRPCKRWENHTDLSLRRANVQSFFAAITGPADQAACSIIDVTLKTSEEEWTFCLSRTDEDHFEDMKQFILHKAKSSRHGLHDSSGVVEMYMTVREGTKV